MKHMRLLAAASAAAFLFAPPAQATLLDFTLTGPYSASWQLDSDPVPDDFDSASFTLWDVEGDFPDAVLDVVDLQFWTASALGGLSIIDFYGGITLADMTGGQLWSGTTDAPTFVTGTYDLEDFAGAAYTLVIAEAGGPAPDVPEPASWAMMIAGFGLAGAALRGARRRVPVGFRPA